MRCLSTPVAVLLCAGAVAGCVHAGDDEPDAQRQPAAPATLTLGGRGPTDASWVADRMLRLRGRGTHTLRAPVNAALVATLGPAAVPNADASAVVYNSWRGRRPVLRVAETESGRDVAVAEGAYAPAWAADGRLAHVQALTRDLTHPATYRGHVVVRASPHAPAVRWSRRAGRYVVAAWARGHLLVYRLGRSFPTLVAFDGPGRERVLGAQTALVAISPDGRRAFLSVYRASPPRVRVVDVASGRVTATLEEAAATAGYLREGGSWEGDLVFAPSTLGVAVFRVAGRQVRLAQMLRTPSRLPLGLLEPQPLPGGRIAAWGELEAAPRQAQPEAVLADCDRASLRCVRAAVGPSTAPPRPVRNPSRPSR